MIQRNRLVWLVLLLVGSLFLLGFSPPQQSDLGQNNTFQIAVFVAIVAMILLLIWALAGSERSASTLEKGPAEPHHLAEAPPVAEEVAAVTEPEPAPAVKEPEPVAQEPAAEPEEEAPPVEEATMEAPAVVPPPEPEPEAPAESQLAEAEPDNLRIIEGIGPKVNGALIDMGIDTFAKLAKGDPEKLEADIKGAGVRIISGAPKTWPEQAALAAEGKWDELEALQNSLKGGRRAK